MLMTEDQTRSRSHLMSHLVSDLMMRISENSDGVFKNFCH